MKNYIVTKLEKNDKYDLLITLLDYEILISTYIKTITLPETPCTHVLLDTALCSGVNPYRFIETTIDHGTMSACMQDIQIITVDDILLATANKVLTDNPKYIETSILTESQIEKLK